MAEQAAQLRIELGSGENRDAEELDQLTFQVQRDIEELAVESVRRVSGGRAPAGAKSAEAATLGALAVAVLPVMVPRLLEFLQSWTLRGENRTVRIKTQVGDRALELEYSPRDVSSAEMTRLVRDFTSALQDQ